MYCAKYLTLTCTIFLSSDFLIVAAITIQNGNLALDLDVTDNGAGLILKLEDEEKFTGWIGDGLTLTASDDCETSDSCTIQSDDITLVIDPIEDGFNLWWSSDNMERVVQDCFDLHTGEVNWYGGPEQWDVSWPIEKLVISNLSYIISRYNNGAVAERYWLNSKGAYIFIDNKAPLIVDQNDMKQDSVCFIAALREPYVERSFLSFNYTLIAKADPKEAHLNAIEQFLGKPTGHPNERIIRNPIWTTWAKYKKDINDDVVLEFAQSIADHGFTGQIEIDDKWETCYGSLIFDENTFGRITSTVSEMKDLGFTVSLWTHPFINTECAEATIGLENGYFLQSYTGENITNWWNGDGYHIDYTKEEAKDWYISRLKNLQELHGIDSFKFDAGEIDFAPALPILTGDIENTPNLLTTEYVRTCAQMGDLLEVRSAWRTQDLPTLLRMIDRDSRWGTDNGLHSVITSLLQMNMNGYNMILPDMVGGNGYSGEPTAELLARWIQANTFMPTMQFSYLPWDITSDEFDGVAIITKYVQLHYDYSDDILKAMDDSIEYGYPVNPPIWWVDPTNPDALKCDDEYLLGDSILVAPVIEEGAVSRDIVIPSGTWKDGNNDDVYEGPQIITDYPAPIDVLPYFIKQS